MTAPAPPRPPTPAEIVDAERRDQLVVDIATAIRAADCNCPPGDPTCEDWTSAEHRAEAQARAVVRVVYPNLAEVKATLEAGVLLADAEEIANRLPRDGDGIKREAVYDLTAGLLRTVRGLYADAERVRVQYGADVRRAYEARDQAWRDVADAHEAIRAVRRAIRHVRTGRG